MFEKTGAAQIFENNLKHLLLVPKVYHIVSEFNAMQSRRRVEFRELDVTMS